MNKALLVLLFLYSISSLASSKFCYEDKGSNPYADLKSYSILIPRFKPQTLKGLIYRGVIDTSYEAQKSRVYRLNQPHDTIVINEFSIYLSPKDKELVDIYFHHSRQSGLAVALKDVYLGDFFHVPIKFSGGEANFVKLLQGHFDEYNRKSKIFFTQKTSDISNRELLSFQDLAFRTKELLEIKDYKLSSFVLTNNCRGRGNFEFEWPGVVKGHIYIDYKIIDKYANKHDYIYSCKEKKKIGFSRELTKTEIRFPKLYFKRFGFGDNGIVGHVLSAYSTYFDDFIWKDLGSFSGVSSQGTLDNVTSVLGPSFSLLKEKKFYMEKGIIPYEEFLNETKRKSDTWIESEPLSYVKVPCKGDKRKAPENFFTYSPYGEIESKRYWKEFPCTIAPHTFLTYQDIYDSVVHLSLFEVDGHYKGYRYHKYYDEYKKHAKKLLTDDKSRPQYHFGEFVPLFDKVEVVDEDNHFSIVLRNKKSKNIVIGNISKRILHTESDKKKYAPILEHRMDMIFEESIGISGLFGINSDPLFSPINERNLKQDKVPYALFFDNDNKILNHHDTEIGIELWSLKKEGDRLILDLVSHERILPVARFYIDL
jgi:hypothetical protein